MSASNSTDDRTVAYYRQSTDKQESLPTQRAWSLRICQRDGLTLVGEFEDEGLSGDDINRPGLADLVAFFEKRFYAREPVQRLLVMNLDRLTRRNSLSTGALLDSLSRHGLRYVIESSRRFDLRNAMDRTLIALGSDFTREPELRAKSSAVLAGMAERARKGLWMGGPVPFGYRLGDDGHLTPGPDEEVQLLRWMFETYASGRLSTNGLAREMNDKTKTRWAASRHWSRNTVLKMLKSRNYLGCIVWGEQAVGKFHRLKDGMVKEREDKEDREQAQLLRRLKHLPSPLAGEEDCIVCPNAHPPLIDPELFEACRRQMGENQQDRSAPRGKGVNVWPLAGQLRCGHCGAPLWVLPVKGPGRHGSTVERARVGCSTRLTAGAERCRHGGGARYLDVLTRVVDLLRKQLGSPGAAAEMEAELGQQLAEEAGQGNAERERLLTRQADLDADIGRAVRNLAVSPDDLREDLAECVRGLKAQREDLGRRLRDLDARARETRLIDPAELRATLETVANLSAAMDTREDAEELRAELRGLVKEVRVFWRDRGKEDTLPRGQQGTKRVVGRVEAELGESLSDLLTGGSRRTQLRITVSAEY